MAKRAGVAALLLILFSVGCSDNNSATAVARRYEKALLARDGDGLCSTFAPKLREVLAEAFNDKDAANCGRYFHFLIGYPHENEGRLFERGKLLALGRSRQVRRQGRDYVRVPAKVRIDFSYTGYTTADHNDGEKGSKTFTDVVWLARGHNGSWRVVKPSLALLAGANADNLYSEASRLTANAAPPDPDYSMNRAERTAREAADYRSSFRRRISHTPLRCPGRATVVEDPARDAVIYPTGSALHPAPARHANDIRRIAVTAERRAICVSFVYAAPPKAPLRVGFTARSRTAFFPPEYIVELDPVRGVRGGGLTTSYRYFRGGERLIKGRVRQISVAGRILSFRAVASFELPPGGRIPADLTWTAGSYAASGTDEVPNHAPTAYVVIRQRDGRIIKVG